jgi:hypothetical protein
MKLPWSKNMNDGLVIVGVVLLYFALQRWILPAMGVPT